MLGLPASQRPECRIVGEDGNVFAIIGRVSRVLKTAGQKQKANEWVARATSGDYTYNGVLALMYEYVEVE
jgi:hypothetical protein